MNHHITTENMDFRLIRELRDDNDKRSEFLHDRDRILFSRSFRRLAAKTQVVTVSGKDSNDHLRSRLTHSLEVMQIASSIGNTINCELERNINSGTNGKKLDIELIEAISLAHDIGHTPYGHVGERALCDNFKESFDCFSNLLNSDYVIIPQKKLKHSFQSLKLCCFLEKQYYPDHYGLNLTVATLDGVLKHSKIDTNERNFYKKCFENYCETFFDRSKINFDERAYQIIRESFEYYSPLTLEGVIVSIADEIAQISHDIEDLRRLSNFYETSRFYEKVMSNFNGISPETMDEWALNTIFADFVNSFKEAKEKSSHILKLERMYTKLILNLSIPLVKNIIMHLYNMSETDRSVFLKNNYTGSFKDLSQFTTDLPLSKGNSEVSRYLKSIFDIYEDMPKHIKNIARWDIKGKEMCTDLSKILFDSIPYEDNLPNLDVFDIDMRPHLVKSYDAGLRFGKSLLGEFDMNLLDEHSLDMILPHKNLLNKNSIDKESKILMLKEIKSEELAKKCLIWDYLAGMTDKYIIKEYESLSFKKVELH